MYVEVHAPLVVEVRHLAADGQQSAQLLDGHDWFDHHDVIAHRRHSITWDRHVGGPTLFIAVLAPE
ncbi:hypothetical protein [Terrabacter sp. 2YAF2]|uniref:hypothetical protein n=1 Tax=Terrabacter sp. 2YAF2 TaxID=3233026 RepID=UPI003F9E6745